MATDIYQRWNLNVQRHGATIFGTAADVKGANLGRATLMRRPLYSLPERTEINGAQEARCAEGFRPRFAESISRL